MKERKREGGRVGRNRWILGKWFATPTHTDEAKKNKPRQDRREEMEGSKEGRNEESMCHCRFIRMIE
jgi:hypothetical protein